MLVRINSWRVSSRLLGFELLYRNIDHHLVNLTLERGGEEKWFILEPEQADKLALRLERFAEWAEKLRKSSRTTTPRRSNRKA